MQHQRNLSSHFGLYPNWYRNLYFFRIKGVGKPKNSIFDSIRGVGKRRTQKVDTIDLPEKAEICNLTPIFGQACGDRKGAWGCGELRKGQRTDFVESIWFGKGTLGSPILGDYCEIARVLFSVCGICTGSGSLLV